MFKIKIYSLMLVALGVFLFITNAQCLAECNESGTYIICEDWDSGTPPDPWPTENGDTWHGWEPAGYGGGDDGDIVSSPYHSSPRCLLLLKGDGHKSTVDISHSISGSPTVVYVRFYLRIPSGETANAGSMAHVVFLNTASQAEVALDLRKCGEYNGGYFDCSSALGGKRVLAVHTYNPEIWIANNQKPAGQRDYFIIDDHEGEWILVEWKVDFAGDKTSLWINETAHVIDYSMPWANSSAGSIVLSGFTQNTSGNIHYYFDDVVVSTSYIGPRSLGPSSPTGLRIIKIE